jgi:hypothetical protein
MGKAVLIGALAVVLLGQTDEGVVTSTDLIAPDVSASERDAQEQPQQPERVAPSSRQEAPVSQEREPVGEESTAPKKEDRAPSEEKGDAPREVTSEEARRHKAVAAFWFILPET